MLLELYPAADDALSKFFLTNPPGPSTIPPRGAGKPMDIPILYQDQALIVCLKPAGLSSEGDGMPVRLRQQCGGDIYCVHRLDLPVGGLMVYARAKPAAAGLSAAIAAGKIQKEYLAVVQGEPQDEAVLRDLLFRDASKNKSYVVQRMRKGVRQAELSYRTLERQGELSLVRIRLYTGRSHQIRVQFASRGMPLAGDRKYGSRFGDAPLALYSSALDFPHPTDGQLLHWEAKPEAGWPWSLFSLL